MATAELTSSGTRRAAAEGGSRDMSFGDGRGSDAAGKYDVPASPGERARLRRLVTAYAGEHGLVAPLCRKELQDHADAVILAAGLGPESREFLMLLLHNEAWRDIVAAVPFGRRTLLLPPCLRSSAKCRAQFDEFGLICERCGSCALGRLSEEAEAMGYAVLIAEGTSVVAGLIERGMVDAVVGVGCMPALERAFMAVSSSAIPGLAVPLLEDGCGDTQVDVDWVMESVRLNGMPPSVRNVDLREFHAEVKKWFEPAALAAMLGSKGTRTEEVAIEWLARAGKRWRPFLAASVFRALDGQASGRGMECIRSVAVAVECMHKASLICDDIQDGDDCRYGEPTVHKVNGVPVALAAGLYLLGQGYRLLSACEAPPARRAAMLQLAAEGHCELCRGQGAELQWMRSPHPLAPEEVLGIFKQKTAPSFDVVLRLGAMCADAPTEVHAVLSEFSVEVGVAYQILDDLDDFRTGGDADDVKSGRPSIVMAMAYERATGRQKSLIGDAWMGRSPAIDWEEVRRLVAATGAEAGARDLLEAYRHRSAYALRGLKDRYLKMLLHRIAVMLLRSE